MMMPGITLPTGPYDWHPERISRATYEVRVRHLREAMSQHAITHTVVHGNCFDHGALAWLTHVTPKLGPAYALIPASGPLRLLFAGGPGMKPSAQLLTWVEDVAALGGIEADVKRWLDGTADGTTAKLALVEGRAMLHGDWLAVQRAAGGTAVELDAVLDAVRAHGAAEDLDREAHAAGVLAVARDTISRLARPGADLRASVIEMERAAYAAGAQDVRVRIGRRPGGLPTTLPDDPLPMTGPTQIAVAVRRDGSWASARFVLGA